MRRTPCWPLSSKLSVAKGEESPRTSWNERWQKLKWQEYYSVQRQANKLNLCEYSVCAVVRCLRWRTTQNVFFFCCQRKYLVQLKNKFSMDFFTILDRQMQSLPLLFPSFFYSISISLCLAVPRLHTQSETENYLK